MVVQFAICLPQINSASACRFKLNLSIRPCERSTVLPQPDVLRVRYSRNTPRQNFSGQDKSRIAGYSTRNSHCVYYAPSTPRRSRLVGVLGEGGGGVEWVNCVRSYKFACMAGIKAGRQLLGLAKCTTLLHACISAVTTNFFTFGHDTGC